MLVGLGLCTRIWVKLTSGAQLRYKLLDQVIDEKLVTLQLAGCISRVPWTCSVTGGGG